MGKRKHKNSDKRNDSVTSLDSEPEKRATVNATTTSFVGCDNTSAGGASKHRGAAGHSRNTQGQSSSHSDLSSPQSHRESHRDYVVSSSQSHRDPRSPQSHRESHRGKNRGRRRGKGSEDSQIPSSNRFEVLANNSEHPRDDARSRHQDKTRGSHRGSHGESYRGTNHNGRGRWSGAGRGQTTARATSQSQSQSSASSSLDLPGFYYDPEKKRYFKIQAGGASADPDIITKESIAKTKAEGQRQKDLAALNQRTTCVLPSASAGRTAKKCVNPSVPFLVLNGYQRGEVSRVRLRRTWVTGSASRLRPAGSRHVFAIPEFHQNLEHMLLMERSKNHDKLLCLWSLSESMVERLQLVTVKETARTSPGELALEETAGTAPGELALDFSSTNSSVLQSWNKITNVCWSDFPQFPDKTYVLYTTRCHAGRTESLAFIRCLDAATQDEVCFFDFNVGTLVTWTCAWNMQRQQFGVGTEKGCLLIDVNTRRLWHFKTNNSDALAQIFTQCDGGRTLYTGTRRGSLLRHDLRSNSALPHHLSNHSTSVTCLRLAPDEQYLYASDFSGNIKKWDLRMKKVVLTYDGLVNSQLRLPFYIDETQSLLYGAGQDCYTRLWDLTSGRPLHSLPPPYEASLHTSPAVQFSSRWAGVEGNVGLIMGGLKSLYLYGPSGASGLHSKT